VLVSGGEEGEKVVGSDRDRDGRRQEVIPKFDFPNLLIYTLFTSAYVSGLVISVRWSPFGRIDELHHLQECNLL
jgi:hypothetical protein